MRPLLERPWGIFSPPSALLNWPFSLSPSLQLQLTDRPIIILIPPYLRTLTQLYLLRASPPYLRSLTQFCLHRTYPTHHYSATSPPLSLQTTMTSTLGYSPSLLNGLPDPVLTSLILVLTFRVSMDEQEPLCKHSSGFSLLLKFKFTALALACRGLCGP